MVIGVVIIGEIIWAGWTLFKPSSPLSVTQQPVVKVNLKPTVISLQSDKSTLKVGEKVTISINISSTKSTDGTDLIILYDPKLLSVDPTTPVMLAKLYDDYPVNKVDIESGKITVSGISNKKGGSVPNGLFGSVVFQGKLPGNAKIGLDFTPGSTGDSNITETGSGKDVLETVNTLQLTLTP